MKSNSSLKNKKTESLFRVKERKNKLKQFHFFYIERKWINVIYNKKNATWQHFLFDYVVIV